MREAAEMSNPTSEYFAAPLEENLFEWHFTVRGPVDTDYQGGVYHGRIIVPVEYPMKPPDIILLTVSFIFVCDSCPYVYLDYFSILFGTYTNCTYSLYLFHVFVDVFLYPTCNLTDNCICCKKNFLFGFGLNELILYVF